MSHSYDELVAWVTREGVKTDHLQIADLENGERGLRAARDIQVRTSLPLPFFLASTLLGIVLKSHCTYILLRYHKIKIPESS
jgi:uncharacterized membrane protein